MSRRRFTVIDGGSGPDPSAVRAAKAAGGVRSSDPESSFLAAENDSAIGSLYDQTLFALTAAADYPDGCMTATDVWEFYGRKGARDCFSPALSRLNDDGKAIYVMQRRGPAAFGKLKMLQAYRLWRPGDPDYVLSPRKRTPLGHALAWWDKLTKESRAEFAERCGMLTHTVVRSLFDRLGEDERQEVARQCRPVTAEILCRLWDGMSNNERGQFAERCGMLTHTIVRSLFDRLGEDDRRQVANKCKPVSADVLCLLWDGMSESERDQFRSWMDM